jgi:hypothetical protein
MNTGLAPSLPGWGVTVIPAIKHPSPESMNPNKITNPNVDALLLGPHRVIH